MRRNVRLLEGERGLSEDQMPAWRRIGRVASEDERFDAVTLACIVAAVLVVIFIASLALWLFVLEPMTHPTCSELGRQADGSNDPQVIGEWVKRCLD
ncbi:MAG TPA: hypothetical protein VLS25_10215 [Dehalococcoidia bacterium]|nr:hypothetical protein [Dehalococcoidia bacterium]